MSRRVGGSPERPRMRGKAGAQDKRPWRDITPPEGPIERRFLHPVLLGESIGPFRVIAPALAVLPIHERRLLNSSSARKLSADGLADWLGTIEQQWAKNAAKKADGSLKMTLNQRIDHQRNMVRQLEGLRTRVAYSKAGTILCATIVRDRAAYVDHMAYWAPCHSEREAGYLVAVLNSSHVLAAIEPMQPKGQGGARHFDNLMWELPIPEYDAKLPLHRALARAAERAEAVAARVVLDPGQHFTRQRRALRDALAADGVMARIDALVERLLAGEDAADGGDDD